MTSHLDQYGNMIWNSTVSIPVSSNSAFYPAIQQGGTMDIWSAMHPKPNRLVVVKLTKENILEVGKSMMRKGGGGVVIEHDCIIYHGKVFKAGMWIVKEYDYDFERDVYRSATPDERVEFDLR